MKNKINKLIYILALFLNSSFAQSSFDSIYKINDGSSGFNIFTYTNYSITSGSSTTWIVDTATGLIYNQSHSFNLKLDNNGNQLSIYKFAKVDSLLLSSYPMISFDNFACAAIEDNKQAIYSSGVQVTINSIGSSQQLLKIVKTDSIGGLIWDYSYKLSSDSSWFARCCFFDNQHNHLIIAGDVNDPNLNYSYPFIVTLDTSGVILNSVRIKNQGFIAIRGITMDNTNNFYCAGVNILGTPNSSPITWKGDQQGNVIWSYNYSLSSYGNYALSIINTTDHNFVVCYQNAFKNGYYWKYHLLKLDSAGNTIWDKIFNYTRQVTSGLTELTNTNLIHVGIFRDTLGADSIAGLLTLFDSSGNKLWDRKFFDEGGYKTLYDVKPTLDGGYIMCGTTGHFFVPVGGFYTGQTWIVKTDSLGLLTSINNHTPDYISEATLNAPFPNPTKDAITIETFVPIEAKKAILHLFDIRGKELLQKEISKGITKTSISLQEYASGNYLIALSIDDYAAGAKRIVKVE